jgi:Tol biopolymer transport system component
MLHSTRIIFALALPIIFATQEPTAAQVLSLESYGSACTLPNGFSQVGRLSADGRWLVFGSFGSNLVPNDADGTEDVFLRDRWTRTTTCISVDPNGVPRGGHPGGCATPDGRWVVFESNASNLVAGDTNGQVDIFVRDVSLGTTVRVSVATGGAQANALSTMSAISADGRFVVFASDASNLVAGDSGTQRDIFLHDRDPDGNGIFDEGNETTVCVSTNYTNGQPANAGALFPRISDDGAFVAYESPASTIVAGDTNGAFDVFLWTRASGTNALLSVATNGAQANGASEAVSLSADGLHASFGSIATNLVPGGDGNSTFDVYVRDLQTGTTELVSVGTTDSHASFWSSISADGRFVVFESGSRLVAADTDDSDDIYLRDRQSGTTTLLTPSTADSCVDPAISSDGGFVAWTAAGFGMVPDDTDSVPDVYVLDRGNVQPVQVPFCSGDGTAGACPCGNSGPPGAGCAHSQGAAALLAAYGTTVPERAVLAVHGEVASALTVFLQGTTIVPATAFGDGLRCNGGDLKRLNVTNAVAGAAYYPACPFGASILAHSAELGDPIPPGATRYYMTYFRDPSPGFCPFPAGDTFNSSNAIALTW